MPDAQSPRIVVFGAGAVGGYFGARLSQAGLHVTFIARGGHLDAIRRHGLQIRSPAGDFVAIPATATDDTSSVGAADVVLVGVKADAISRNAEALRPLLGARTVVVPLQNGVEAASDLMQAAGSERVIGGLCRIVASVTAPGLITHAGIEPTVVIGELDGSRSARTERVAALLKAADVAVEISDDIQAALWEKFLLIAPWGGLGGVTRVPLDVICSSPDTRRLLETAMNEVAALATAHGITLPADTVSRTLRFLDAVPAGGTASMQRDLMEGRPSELDAQTGTIVRLGRKMGVDTPVNRFIYDCLAPGERLARARI